MLDVKDEDKKKTDCVLSDIAGMVKENTQFSSKLMALKVKSIFINLTFIICHI